MAFPVTVLIRTQNSPLASASVEQVVAGVVAATMSALHQNAPLALILVVQKVNVVMRLKHSEHLYDYIFAPLKSVGNLVSSASADLAGHNLPDGSFGCLLFRFALLSAVF